MERRNKRDAKFLIFQSLYIIAIAILFYKGTDLTINKVAEINSDEKVVPITSVMINPEIEEVLPKPEDGKEYAEINSKEQEIVDKEEFEKLKKDITQLENENRNLRNQKTPNRVSDQTNRTESNNPKTDGKGGVENK